LHTCMHSSVCCTAQLSTYALWFVWAASTLDSVNVVLCCPAG
jgi:hypothetical protein